MYYIRGMNLEVTCLQLYPGIQRSDEVADIHD